MRSSRESWFDRFMRWAEGEDPEQDRKMPEDPELAEFRDYLEYLEDHKRIDFWEYRRRRQAELARKGAAVQPAPEEEPEVENEAVRLHYRPGRLRSILLLYRVLALLAAGVVLVFFLAVALALPPFGGTQVPALNEVTERYLEDGLEETGATNAVAGLILDYRAFDTFGESTVLFAATMSVVLLLRRPRRETPEDDGPRDLVLQRVGLVVLPAVMMFGAYVVLNGHLSPGGGFSGGTVMGCGLILCSMVLGRERLERFASPGRLTGLTVGCLLTYGILKGYSFFTGANHVGWEVPKGTPGAIFSAGFILPLNICVGIIVACTMYTFFTLFSEKEE